jgi:hypothetical protein
MAESNSGNVENSSCTKAQEAEQGIRIFNDIK